MGIAKEFNEYPVLIAVLHCLATLKEKERRGVGKQNMPYSPALDSFLHSLNEVSEDACLLFQQHFCGRTKKNKQKSLVPSKSLMALLAVSTTDPTSQLGDILLPLPQEDHSTTLNLEAEAITNSNRKDNGAQEIEQREIAWQNHALQYPNDEIPCPGLTAMPEYVDACFQLVGGSRPRHILAKDYLPQALSDGKLVLSSLTPPQHDLLNDAVFHESIWRIDKAGKCVRSRQCTGTCTRKAEACTHCLLLLRNASFRSAVSRAKRRAQDPSARLESLRFVPRQFTKRDPLLRKVAANPSLRTLVVEAKSIADDTNVFWLQLARLGLNGAFRTFPVVEGVVQSVIDLKDKARRGVGKQNMSYTPALDSFLQQLSDISLPAFELFAKQFCVRSLRSSKLVKKRKLEQIENPNEPMAMPAMLMYPDDAQERLLALNDMTEGNATIESNVVLKL
ncbi:hypothetical protein THRCLA_05734 [Thraustotheca clavata]|uniref:Uncharacterized protein n=1 Tax=Thraustotheca clavata TaxID=74557 RepID=A0A1V9ZVJ7_9STRA|nr:hypothetical protein THRCLA_05734 [Thraustotheca clavata]